jgi:hypothetical protein
MTAQALLGNVPPSMTAVAIRLAPDSLSVRFAVAREADDIAEAVEEIVSDLDAFYSHLADAPRVEPEVVIGQPDPSWNAAPWRMVFAAQISKNLTDEQAFRAMFRFLESYWSEFKTATLADVLSDLNPGEQGRSSDPAMWSDWRKAIDTDTG